MSRETIYGAFPGGDPRRFRPDAECCSAEEMAAHKAACEAWDRGERVDRGPSCATMGDGSLWRGDGFGIGTYEVDIDDPPLDPRYCATCDHRHEAGEEDGDPPGRCPTCGHSELLFEAAS